jgi:hypothetical protein
MLMLEPPSHPPTLPACCLQPAAATPTSSTAKVSAARPWQTNSQVWGPAISALALPGPRLALPV